MRYNIDKNGYVTSIGFDVCEIELTNEPFDASTSHLYQLVNGAWTIIGNSNWHYPEKPYRFFVPKDVAFDIATEMPELAFWIKKEGMLTAKTTDGSYVYAGVLQPVVFNEQTLSVEYIIGVLKEKYGCTFQTKAEVLGV